MSNVSVAVRVRPISKREEAQAAKIIVSVKDEQITVTNPKVPANQEYDNREKSRQFSVDFAYLSLDINSAEYVTQECIYQSLGVNVLTSVFEGFNACVLAYGQSGTGKTYTMMGHSGDLGLTPRICQGLFSRISTMNDKKMTFRIEVSFLEIYNERVVDLLRSLPSRKPRQTLKVREHPKFGPYVQDLSRHVVTDFNTTQALLEKGIQNRSVAATRMHDYSSRSHAIFTIYFTQARLDEEFPSEVTSKIHLVDLAGSERATSDLSRARLKEGANINKSLVALGNVICSLADKSQSVWSLESTSSSRSSTGDSAGCPTSTASPVGSPGQKPRVAFVPYRDSVLTWLLKDSLGGNAKTFMLATISPASVSYSETLSTLRYAQRAKCIVNRPITNEDASVKLIRELRAEIERLRAMLSNTQNDPENHSEEKWPVCQIISRNENKAEELTRTWFEKWKEMQHQMHFTSFLAREHSMDDVVDCEMPYLIGINSDMPTSGVHIYYLKEGKMMVGNSNCSLHNIPDISICGEDIAEQHCILHLEDRIATLTPSIGALCLLNGVKIASPAKVSLGDVIQLGKSITLRYLDPWQLPRRSKSIQSGQDFLCTSTEHETIPKSNNTEVYPFHAKNDNGFQQWGHNRTAGPKQDVASSELKDPNADSLLGDSQSDLASCEDIPECKSVAEDWFHKGANNTSELIPEDNQISPCSSEEMDAADVASTVALTPKNTPPQSETVSEIQTEDSAEVVTGVNTKKQKNCKGLRLVIMRAACDAAQSIAAEESVPSNDELHDSLESLDKNAMVNIQNIVTDSWKSEEDCAEEGEVKISTVDVKIRSPESKVSVELPTADTRYQCFNRSKTSDFNSTDEENWTAKGGKCRRKTTAFNAMIAMQKRRKKRKKALPSRCVTGWDSTSEDELLPSNSHIQSKKVGLIQRLNRLEVASPPALPSPYSTTRLSCEDGMFKNNGRPNGHSEINADISTTTEEIESCYLLSRCDRGVFGNVAVKDPLRFQSGDLLDQAHINKVWSSRFDPSITTDSLEDEECSLTRLNMELDETATRFGGSSKTFETWPTSCDSLTFVYLGPAADWKPSCDILQCEKTDSGDKWFSNTWEQQLQPSTRFPPSDESDTLTQELSALSRNLGKTYSVLPKLSNSNDEICSISDEDLSGKCCDSPAASLRTSLDRKELRGIRDYSQSTLDVIGNPEKIPDATHRGKMKQDDSGDHNASSSTCAEKDIVTIPAEDTTKESSVGQERQPSSVPKGTLGLNAFDSGIFVGLHGTTSNTLRNLQMSFSFCESSVSNNFLTDVHRNVETATIGSCDVAIAVNKPREMENKETKSNGQNVDKVLERQNPHSSDTPKGSNDDKSATTPEPGSPFQKMQRHIMNNVLGGESDEDLKKSFCYWEQQVWPSGHGFSSFLSPSTSAPPGFLPQSCRKIPTIPKSNSSVDTESMKAKSEPSKRRVSWTWKDPVDMLIDLSQSDLEGRCGSLEAKLDMLEKRHKSMRREKNGSIHCDALDMDPRGHCECNEIEIIPGATSSFSGEVQAKVCTCSSRNGPVSDGSSSGHFGPPDSDVEFSGNIPEDMIRLLRECRDVRKKAWREIGLAHNQLRSMEEMNGQQMYPPCPIHEKMTRK